MVFEFFLQSAFDYRVRICNIIIIKVQLIIGIRFEWMRVNTGATRAIFPVGFVDGHCSALSDEILAADRLAIQD